MEHDLELISPILEIVDRTIHISVLSWKYWIVRSTISRIGLNRKNMFSKISRIIENVADLNFQYFQDRNK